MIKMTQEEVDEAIHLHWLYRDDKSTTGTLRIDPSGIVDLKGADLRDADMRDINLRRADLSGADLSGAIFPGDDF